MKRKFIQEFQAALSLCNAILFSPGFAGVLRRRAEALLTTVDTKESISLPESHLDLLMTDFITRASSSVSLSLLVGGILDSSLSGTGTFTSRLNTPIIVTSWIPSAQVNGCVKVLRMLLFRCFTFAPSESERLLSNFESLTHFRSDGERDFFLELRRLLQRLCLLDSLALCIVVSFGSAKEKLVKRGIFKPLRLR